ncbi:unnamed protein product [Eruca vesicaria subsp. sativa]|uniref:Uncharacterized protein n=1 Tax=Eruca vesicaria subsp. sativa TaxID=29727 RepID=A0ABC8M6E4_ERUVS|nr:unnamed protein product [Eruca vesicaria subsp. sativa]
MVSKCGFVSVVWALFVLTIFNNPTIVYAGEGVPDVALFAFGDSSYDAGNAAFIGKNTGGPQFTWPYGKSRDDPNGKFSDGHIVTDFIGDFISIPDGIPPALNPGANLSRGASFAVAGASILGAPAGSMTLNQQVNKFRTMKSTWTDDYIEKSLFMIYIGMEDYLNFSKTNPSANDPSAQQAFVISVTNKLKNDIGLLYSLGASKFMVQLLAPLGCLPIIRQEHGTGNDCYQQLNDLAKQHNDKIGPMLNQFAKTSPGFQFTVFDFYNAIIRRTQRNTNYRFFVTNSSCCGVGTHNAYGCGMGNVHSKLCEYQRSYLYFDGRHNTEKAQEEFAHLAYGANTNVVQPMTIRELIVYPVGQNMLDVWVPNLLSSIRRRPSTYSHQSDSHIGFSAY